MRSNRVELGAGADGDVGLTPPPTWSPTLETWLVPPRPPRCWHLTLVTAWRLCPVVDALPACHGVPLTMAVTPVAALDDLPRGDHPRPRMTYLGLTPAA